MSQFPSSADPVDPPEHSLDCFRSFQFITENPKWMSNVMFIAVCQFIPFLGPISILGYQFEVAESLLRQSKPGSYPDFDFNKFVEYLMRGLWPFLVALIMAMAMIPIIILCVVSMFLFVAANEAGPNAVGMAAGGILLAVVFVIIVLIVGTNVLSIPLQLRAGYCQDLGQAFDFRFAMDFLRLMWKETLIAMLFIMISAIPLMFLGMLMCFVGVYFTMAMLMLAQAHLIDFQLYSIYLSKGGTPIPLKEPIDFAIE